MVMSIDHQQLLFTVSLVDLPLSNAILKEKKCVHVVNLRLKRIWAGILFNRLSATVSVAMVTRHRMIETLLYAMQDTKEWLKVNASRGWSKVRRTTILHRKVSKGWFFTKVQKSQNWQNSSDREILAYYSKSIIRVHGLFLHIMMMFLRVICYWSPGIYFCIYYLLELGGIPVFSCITILMNAGIGYHVY